jgi:hypothetical protein
MRDYRGIWKINWARQPGIKISQFFNFMNEHYEGGETKYHLLRWIAIMRLVASAQYLEANDVKNLDICEINKT